MRGEHRRRKTQVIANQGSSPHARGTLGRGDDQRDADGIIPACAGNTSVFDGPISYERDHPRMRGEHRTDVEQKRKETGSSPHARGTL